MGKPVKPLIFLMKNIFREKEEIVRLVIPGIDRGSAVWFEATFDLPPKKVKRLLPAIVKALKNPIKIEKL